jgi:hypothetical protein
VPGVYFLRAGGRGHCHQGGGRGHVDIVDNVDHLILSAQLMAGGRGGHAIVDNVDQLKNNGPHNF